MSKPMLPSGYTDEQGRPMGLFLAMPEAEYHAVKAFSYSGSKQFARSPSHFQAYLRKKWEINASREFFKAVHLFCLEPEEHKRVVVKDGRWAGALKAEVEALQRTGNIVVKQDDYDTAKLVAESLKSHQLAGAILSSALTEASIFWIDPATGVYCKGRIDSLYVDEEEISIGDLKNAGDISNEHILADLITKNKFHYQQAFYGAGIKEVFGRSVTNHYWFFVEGDEPFGVKVRTCTEPMIERANADIRPMLEYFKECEESDTWPGYAQDADAATLTRFGWELSE